MVKKLPHKLNSEFKGGGELSQDANSEIPMSGEIERLSGTLFTSFFTFTL